MKVLLLYIGVLFGTQSCLQQGFQTQTGDILFQSGKKSEMAHAIDESTGDASTNFTHVAIALGADSVVEATSDGGVRRISLVDFLNTSALIGGKPAVVVFRLCDTLGASKAAHRALQFLGQPYDYSFRPNNESIYCSELVFESYLTPDERPRFTSRPMNFRDSNGALPLFWQELFESLGEQVPEGVAGTNPNDLSKESIIGEVHRYF